MSRSDAWVTQSSEREGWGRCGSLQTSAGEPGELTKNPVHRRHYWPRAVSLCSPDQNLLRLPTPRMDDPGTRVAPGNRMACALPRPCVTGLLSPCPPIFPLCPSLSLLHAPGLCCSSHLPRPGQARGHCYAWSVLPQGLAAIGGGGLVTMPPPRMGPPDCMYPHHHPVTFLYSPGKQVPQSWSQDTCRLLVLWVLLR